MSPRLRLFLSYYRPYRRLLALDLLCAFVVSGVTLALPLLAGQLTRELLANPTPAVLDRVLELGLLMLGLSVLYAVCNTFVDYQGHMMGTRMERDLRRDLFAHLSRLSFGFFDHARVGQLMSRLTNDLLGVSELYHHGPEDLAIGTVKAVGVFLILAGINLELTLLLFALLPLMTLYALYFNRRMNRAARLSRERIADVNAQAEDTLAGIRTVQSFGGEVFEARKFALEDARFVQSRADGYRSEAFFYEGMTAFTQLLTLGVVVLGGVAIAQAQLEPADLVTYLLCVGVLTDPIARFTNFARLYQEGITGFERFAELLELEPEIRDRPDALGLKSVRGELEFRGVSFRYGEGLPNVLKGLNLHIRAGEFVALVGPSGVGKTTLCALIPRFYEVSAGQILLDDTDLRDVRLADLRRAVGVVQQDVYLFSGTVLENIAYGKPGASREEVIEAARQANALGFIEALPQGLDTDIGQRGVRLSGGQKQRLSIARVFLKDPPILILDEATSALDSVSERAVQDSLERLSRQRTTLVIAHRLSTVQNAGRILVMTEAGIVEQGTHAELMALAGVYAGLHRTQLRL